MCCTCGRIRRLATKNGIRNYCCTLIAWIIRGNFLYLPLPHHPHGSNWPGSVATALILSPHLPLFFRLRTTYATRMLPPS